MKLYIDSLPLRNYFNLERGTGKFYISANVTAKDLVEAIFMSEHIEDWSKIKNALIKEIKKRGKDAND